VVDPGGVEPVDPAGGLPLDLCPPVPGSGPVVFDELGLVEADGGLHESVVEGVADGPDRGRNPSLDEGFGETQRRILRAGVGMEDQAGGGEPSVARRRVNNACSRADMTSGVVLDDDTRHPRIRLEQTSVTKLV